MRAKNSRRDFLTRISLAAGISAVLPAVTTAGPGNASAHLAGMTVQQVIDLILKTIPGAPFNGSVDTIKTGKGDQEVTGIVTTMFATVDVIKKSASLGVNFIIAHEPTFYNHRDETDWLENNQVFQQKKALLAEHGIAVWRFHDYWHMHKPDGVQTGVLGKLGWDNYADRDNSRLLKIPPMKLRDLIAHAKKSLGVRQVRFIGDPDQECTRVGLLPGASGGRSHIQFVGQEKPHVLIVGEISEWETAEYIRDAQSMGIPMSLVVLGHAESEDPGMEWLVSWLQPKVPGIKVTHVPSPYPFREG
jgi:putative NIF3 family GTP cyclohydrolase 1 type 2